MGSSILPIIYIFIVLVIAYITIGYKKLGKIDCFIIAISLVVLVFTIFKTGDIKEHYVDLKLDNLKPIELEEDISAIKDKLVVYTTAFNKISYNENGNSWLNMVVPQKDGSCEIEANNSSVFNFELPPVFSRKSGFYMGNNRIVGPYCNSMNIQFHNTFTIVLACKHGNLLVEESNNEIELLKFYANSPNNNGISLYIQRGSLRNVNNVQMGKLMLQYSSREAFQCKLKADHELISFEKDIYTFYFIIKDTDHIRVAVMTEKNTNVDEILRFNVENSDVTFSNKEFVINRLKNWNGHVYNFAMFKYALSDDDITALYAHMLGEYMKYVNPNYINVIQQYNETLNLLSKFSSCPYDKNVCNTCNTVNKWNSMDQVVSASSECRDSINEFCMANLNHPLCKCWNTQNSNYNTDTCKMYRGIFTDKASYLDGLSQDDIDYIMAKYKLIRPDNCPKPIVKPEFFKNKYPAYDFNKIKITLQDNENERSGTVAKLYDAKAELDDKEEDYNWDKLKIKYDEDSKPIPNAKDLSEEDMRVMNFYKKDTDMNYKLNEELDRIHKYSKVEQEKLRDTKDMNIFPDSKKIDDIKNSDRIIPFHKKFFESSTKTPTTTQKPSGFFEKYLKINV